MIRVVIADDHDLVRAGLRAILDAEDDLQVVAEAGDGAAAAMAAATQSADVVLMDVQMPGTDGIAGVDAVAAARPQARVLMLTTYDTDDYLFQALKAGASGFLLKTATPQALVAAVREVHDGRQMFSSAVTERLVRSYVEQSDTARGDTDPLAALTEREREVFLGVARGRSNGEIAADLYLSEATVKTYLTRLLGKLGLRDRVQAVILAYEQGIVRIDP